MRKVTKIESQAKKYTHRAKEIVYVMQHPAVKSIFKVAKGQARQVRNQLFVLSLLLSTLLFYGIVTFTPYIIANSLRHPSRKTQIYDWAGVQFEFEFFDGFILNHGVEIYGMFRIAFFLTL
jgi:uncharacterized protein YegJ (DUF2314 family)